MTTQYQLQKYCDEILGCVSPVEHVLGKDENEKVESFQYVPILDVLKTILEKYDVWAAVNEQSIASDEDATLLQCETDGSFFKEHSLFQGDKRYIRIHMYTDEFEVVNPEYIHVHSGQTQTIEKVFIQ